MCGSLGTCLSNRGQYYTKDKNNFIDCTSCQEGVMLYSIQNVKFSIDDVEVTSTTAVQQCTNK